MNTQKRADVFESDRIGSAVLRLALPTVVSQLITTVYNLADTFFVSMTGDHTQLAALSIVFPTQLALTALGNLFGIGAGNCISKALGAKDPERARNASRFAIWYGGLVVFLLSLAVGFFETPFLHLLGSTAELNAPASAYLKWVVVLGALPAVFNMILANLIRGEGRSFHAGLGLSLGGVLNILLDPFFVLPFGLGWEIRGAAIATFLSNLATTLYFVILYLKIRKTSVISFAPRLLRAARETGADVLFTGVPSALQTMLSAVSNLALNSLMIGYGAEAEAAIGVTKKIDAIPFGLITGLSQGAAPLIAYQKGAGNREKMQKALRVAMCYCVGLGLTVLVLVESLAPWLVAVFAGGNETVCTYGTGFLRLHCIAVPFAAVTYMTVSFFQATGAKLRAFVLSVIRKGLIDIPLMFFMNTVFPMYGIVACQPITDCLSAFSGVLLYFFWKKTQKRLAVRLNG